MTQTAPTADKDATFARYRRRDHANIESLQNSVIAEIARRAHVKYISENPDDETPRGFEMPPDVRHLISALQGMHGGGAVPFEEFSRDYLSIAAQLQFRGSEEARRSRVRARIKALDDWQFSVGVELLHIEPGGKIVTDPATGRAQIYPDGSPVRTKTVVIDYLKPRADEGVQRARLTPDGRPSPLWKEHPGKALEAQVDSVIESLPKLGTRAESGKVKTSKPLPVDVYEQRQEERIKATIEKVAHEIELKGGDSGLWVRKLAREVLKMAGSLAKTEVARHDLIALQRVEREEDTHAGGSNAYMCKSEGPEVLEPTEDLGKKKLTQASAEIAPFQEIEEAPVAGIAPEVLAERDRRIGHALQFAAERIGVLPIWGVADGICDCPKGSECRSPGKHPHGRLAPNGVYSATYDSKTIRCWFDEDPRINYGIAMGGELNLVCVDIDPRNDGNTTYCDLVEHFGVEAFPVTFEQRTGGDGWHKLYRLPEAIKAAKGELKAKLGPGVDVKGVAGYVVGAASMHVSGKTYEVSTNEYIAHASDCLVDALKKSAAGLEPEKVIDFQAHRDRKGQVYAGAARRFGVGERNDGLRDVCLGRWVNGWAETPEELLRQLVEVRDTRCDFASGDPPPTDTELRDLVERTVRKYARGVRQERA